MRLFDFLKGKPSALDDDESFEEFAARLLADSAKNDHLGMAAIAGSKAQEAVASGKYDVAWGLYQDQKHHYLQHAARCGFTKAQALALDAAVSQPMANILRLEGKHYDALVHIVYWVAASPRITKSQQQKLPAYFNRCKFKAATLSDVNTLVDSSRSDPDFVRIRDTIGGWRDRG